MKNIIYWLLLLPIFYHSSVQAKYNCDNMIGSWFGEIYNEEKDYRDTFVDTFQSNGIFVSEYEGFSISGNEIDSWNYLGKSSEKGKWSCDGETFTMIGFIFQDEPMLPVKKVYQILELTDSYMKYTTIKGHSIGLVYEVYKKYGQ